MINSLLAQYKHFIDFDDKMQKSNFKFVEKYIAFQQRKNRKDWEQDCVDFLVDAIDLQNMLLSHIRNENEKG